MYAFKMSQIVLSNKQEHIFVKVHAKCILYLRVELQGSQDEREEGRPAGRKGTQSGMPLRWPGLQQRTRRLAGRGGWDVSRGDTGPLCLRRLQEGGGRENMGKKAGCRLSRSSVSFLSLVSLPKIGGRSLSLR